MTSELNIRFTGKDRYSVRFRDSETGTLTFTPPVTAADRQDIRWYLETYAAHYTSEPDDERAVKIEANLPVWGDALFKSVFTDITAANCFFQFFNHRVEGRVLTVSAEHPAVLSLPWELLGIQNKFLFNENPRISVRRRLSGAGGIGGQLSANAKDRLHLLFVVSRPKDAGFIDPRSDAMAVMDALESKTLRRVEVEFLRPATPQNLESRLNNNSLPRVDILHFDGHGIFDKDDNEGYLLFESQRGTAAEISAERMAEIIKQQVRLVILSACKSAELGEEDAMGSVAARLTHAGVPSVLAMTHSVLVATTRALFGAFYEHLAYGQGVGASLDDARRYLYMKPERGERRRGEQDWITLKVHDWFLPALYQQGADMPLLTKHPPAPLKGGFEERNPLLRGDEWVCHNLPELKGAGFFGRTRELWDIETAFVRGTRRLTISGFGGQGKTFLAAEAARWLVRTGMFRKACFVGYADFQVVDPKGVAISTLSTVLNQSLSDEKAATDALKQTPTLMILDNLESLSPEARTALLNVAVSWSEAGNSRVLLTTRQADFEHPEYPDAGTWEHVRLDLKGLHENDAVAFFQAVMKLPPLPKTEPPKRHALTNLFEMVNFHPLSVGLLAELLKAQRPANLGQSLEELLKQTPSDDPNRSLMASLNLSLQRLDAEAQKWLPQLGVFQGGAMEDVLLKVTGLGKTDEDPEIAQARMLLEALKGDDPILMLRMIGANVPEGVKVSDEILGQLREQTKPLIKQLTAELAKHSKSELALGADEKTWNNLRRALENTGLIRAEIIPGHPYPFLKFHPTLAPALRAKLTETELKTLNTRHTQEYYRFSGWLLGEDVRNVHVARPIAFRELPNLLHAVHAALDAGNEDAVDFADNVNWFLNFFSLTRDRKLLIQNAQKQTPHGSKAWCLARFNLGEQLYSAGRYGEAKAVFSEILRELGDEPTYQRCVTLDRLGRCCKHQGNSRQAAAAYHQGLGVAGKLEQDQGVKWQIGALQCDLANALTDIGDYAGARMAYDAALGIAKEQNNGRQIGVVNGQLGTLAMLQGSLNEAVQRFQEALAVFRQINEPASEAVAWHQLGNAFQQAGQWEESESAYRESARINENQGNLTVAAQTWNNLAILTKSAGKPDRAEAWYRKAIEGGKKVGDRVGISKGLSNLANLLQNTPARLNEARQFSEEALEIKKTLDPGASEIWTTYTILAQIADKQNQTDSAREYRRLAREARARFMGTQHELQKHGELIAAVVAVVKQPELADKLEPILEQRLKGGWENLVAAIRRILSGERDENSICDALDLTDSMIVRAILQGIENPESLEGLM